MEEEINLMGWQQFGERMKKAYPLCHLGKERVFGGEGPLDISEGGLCNNKEDKGMGTEGYLRPLAGAKGFHRETIASSCTEGHLLRFNTESHNLKEEDLKET